MATCQGHAARAAGPLKLGRSADRLESSRGVAGPGPPTIPGRGAESAKQQVGVLTYPLPALLAGLGRKSRPGSDPDRATAGAAGRRAVGQAAVDEHVECKGPLSLVLSRVSSDGGGPRVGANTPLKCQQCKAFASICVHRQQQ
jgi:hypothetical protein